MMGIIRAFDDSERLVAELLQLIDLIQTEFGSAIRLAPSRLSTGVVAPQRLNGASDSLSTRYSRAARPFKRNQTFHLAPVTQTHVEQDLHGRVAVGPASVLNPYSSEEGDYRDDRDDPDEVV
jgi:hypothetical protein